MKLNMKKKKKLNEIKEWIRNKESKAKKLKRKESKSSMTMDSSENKWKIKWLRIINKQKRINRKNKEKRRKKGK